MESRVWQPHLCEVFSQLFLKGYPLRLTWWQPGVVAVAWREGGGLRIPRWHPLRVCGFGKEEEGRARGGSGVSGVKLDQEPQVQVTLGQGERKTFDSGNIVS